MEVRNWMEESDRYDRRFSERYEKEKKSIELSPHDQTLTCLTVYEVAHRCHVMVARSTLNLEVKNPNPRADEDNFGLSQVTLELLFIYQNKYRARNCDCCPTRAEGKQSFYTLCVCVCVCVCIFVCLFVTSV